MSRVVPIAKSIPIIQKTPMSNTKIAAIGGAILLVIVLLFTTWIGWTARIPADAGEITADDIDCTLNEWPRDGGPQWGSIEIVERQ